MARLTAISRAFFVFGFLRRSDDMCVLICTLSTFKCIWLLSDKASISGNLASGTLPDFLEVLIPCVLFCIRQRCMLIVMVFAISVFVYKDQPQIQSPSTFAQNPGT